MDRKNIKTREEMLKNNDKYQKPGGVLIDKLFKKRTANTKNEILNDRKGSRDNVMNMQKSNDVVPENDAGNIDRNMKAGIIPWKKFDGAAYVDPKRILPGQDKYKRNKFNQDASDKLSFDRSVPDTRNDL